MTEPRDRSAAGGELPPRPADEPAAREAELRTFLIADIRGYTTYTSERGDEAGAALAARFAELVADVVKSHDGTLIELRGDEALVMFVSARKALRAAVDMQARFAQAELPRGVGIGLDAGEAIPVGDGFRGSALNLAARLCAQAGPGETLASETVIHLAAKVEGIAYVDPRALRLKGYSEAIRVVDVVPADRAKGRRLASRGRARDAGLARFAALVGGALAVLVGLAVVVNALGSGPFRPPQTAGPVTSAPDSSFQPQPSLAAASSPTAAPSGPVDPLGGAELPILAFYNATTGELTETTPFKSPRNISLFSGGSFWILGDNPRAFNRVDPETHEIVQSIPIPVVEVSGFNMDDRSIWVTDLAGPRVVRIDKRNGVVSEFSFARDESDTAVAHDIAVGDGSVWLSRPDIPEVTRIDAVTGEVQARLDVYAFGLTFGEGALWFWIEGSLGRIDPVTNERTFDELALGTVGWLGNIQTGGGYAWTVESTTGTVWRVDRSGGRTPFALPPGSGELAWTPGTMWVTNVNTGQVIGIDAVTGQQNGVIDTGHATLAVAAGAGELMIAVGPTVDEAIADLEGSVLRVATVGQPWTNPGPDPALNDVWEARQLFYLTCVHLVNYPDEPAPEGWVLQPEAAEAMPTVSADGRTYTFKIRPGFAFSPPSDEPVTAETFQATLERVLDPVLGDDAPGPRIFSDIEGVAEYRAGSADDISGIVADGDQLTITLEQPAPDLLARLASAAVCPVPLETPALRSGLNPDPPVSGAGPYYLASTIRRRLVVFQRNPNYPGPRAQPFDAIAIRMDTAPATAIEQVESGLIDAAFLGAFDPLTGPQSALAAEWGPESENAAAGDQRWFGAPRIGPDFIALNPRGPLRELDVRRAIAQAIDRAAIAGIFGMAPTDDLLLPGMPGTTVPPAPPAAPDLDAARALMNGRTIDLIMQASPEEWGCGQCRDFEVAVTGQLRAIGVNVTMRRLDDYPADAFEDASGVHLVQVGTGSEVADPVAMLGGLYEVPWLGDEVLGELERLEILTGEERLGGAIALARRLVEEEFLLIPTGYPVLPTLLGESIGCGVVQPAIGALDLLSLCIEDGSAP